MTIDGNIKTFELSKSLSKNGATATASSGNSAAGNLIDFSKITRWQSVGSDDSTTETLQILFPSPVDITRLFVLNHNWKAYTIKPITTGYILDNYADEIDDNYSLPIEDDGSTLEFQASASLTSNVLQDGISETSYSLSSSYYEVNSMYCSGLDITVTEAQELNDEPDQEKYAFNVIPTSETNTNQGTFELYPILNDLRDYQSINNRILNGLYRPEKMLDVFTCALILRANGSENDAILYEHLRYRTGDFLIWPNGGKATNFYRFNTRPYRLEDIYQVQTINAGMLTYINNIYNNPQAASMLLRESV
jgi:hypothetical protein